MIIGMMKIKDNSIYSAHLLLVIMLSALPIISMAERELTIVSLLAQFSAVKESRVKFSEERTYNLLNEKIKLKGSMLYTAPDTLIKETAAPEYSYLKISGDELTIKAQSEQKKTIVLSDHPIIEMFVESYRGLLTGDLEKLKRHYEISFQVYSPEKSAENFSWRLTLIPNDEESLEYIEKIIIIGSKTNISEIVTFEAGGDKSVLTITNAAQQ